MNKNVIMIFAVVGSMVGGYVPVLWGENPFDAISILAGLVGGIAGIWLGVVFSKRFVG